MVLHIEFNHGFVDHAVTCMDGKVRTTTIENFWSLLKSSLNGTYVSVEPLHLFRYLDEQAFRYNKRKDSDQGRFMKAARGIVVKGIRYLQLTGDGAQPA